MQNTLLGRRPGRSHMGELRGEIHVFPVRLLSMQYDKLRPEMLVQVKHNL